MADLEDDDSPLARYALDHEPGDQLSPAAALEGLHLAIRARAGAAKRSQQTTSRSTMLRSVSESCRKRGTTWMPPRSH